MKIAKDMRGWIGRLVAVAATLCTIGTAAFAQAPNSVLVFPAYVDGAANNPSAKLASKLVTDEIRRSISKYGIGVVIYDKSLPSVQRAVQENEKGIKADDAAAGPGDDPRKARNLAEVAGAAEYIVAIIDDYKYDSKTRTATFNLSLTRSTTADGTAINTVANKQTGVATSDVAPSRQEGSAIVTAAKTGADQGVSQLYPDMRIPEVAVKPEKKHSKLEKYALPAFVVGLGVLFFSTR
ncbi:MAG: hypothetical protein QM758_24040 [Armatimonas sp.]